MIEHKVAAHRAVNLMTAERVRAEVDRMGGEVAQRCVERLAPVAGILIEGWFADGVLGYLAGCPEQAVRLLEGACELAEGVWRSLRGETREVVFELGGTRVESLGYLDKRLPHPSTWLSGLALSVCLDRDQTVRVLAAAKREHIDPQVGRFWTPRIAAVEQFVRGQGDGSQLRDVTLEGYGSASKKLDRYGQLIAAEYDLMAAIAAGDQNAYTTGLVTALKQHKAWYGRASLKNGAAARVALPTCMLVVLAKQRGLSREVESDYLPDWLVGEP